MFALKQFQEISRISDDFTLLSSNKYFKYLQYDSLLSKQDFLDNQQLIFSPIFFFALS